MSHKMRKFYTRSLDNATFVGIMLSLILCLTICLPVTGCSRKSGEKQVSSTKKPETTSSEPSTAKSSETTEGQMTESSASLLQGDLEISLNYKQVAGIASNQYAVWIEDGDGKFIRTLFATSFSAGGGWEDRPESLMTWVERSGLSSGNAQEIDAYSGATPESGKQIYTWDCKDESGQAVPAGEYHFFVEGTIYWENAVLFEGVIDLSTEENTAQAEAFFTNDEAKKSDMITEVSAVFRP